MSRFKIVLRYLLAAIMIIAGVAHLRDPDPFVRIMPRALPSPLALVYLSGVAEIAGGIGLLIARLRRAAAFGLIALYVAVFPANINMAIHNIQPVGHEVPTWILWARLPIQPLLIWIAWWFTRPDSPRADAR